MQLNRHRALAKQKHRISIIYTVCLCPLAEMAIRNKRQQTIVIPYFIFGFLKMFVTSYS